MWSIFEWENVNTRMPRYIEIRAVFQYTVSCPCSHFHIKKHTLKEVFRTFDVFRSDSANAAQKETPRLSCTASYRVIQLKNRKKTKVHSIFEMPIKTLQNGSAECVTLDVNLN